MQTWDSLPTYLTAHLPPVSQACKSGLRSDLHLFFEDSEADRTTWCSASTCEKRHGRLEMRTLVASRDLTDYFAREWPGIAQVFRHLVKL